MMLSVIFKLLPFESSRDEICSKFISGNITNRNHKAYLQDNTAPKSKTPFRVCSYECQRLAYAPDLS